MSKTFTKFPVALKKVPTSCACGGDTAWVMSCVVLDEDMQLGPQLNRGTMELMVGCVCHTTIEDLADMMARTCGGDMIVPEAFMYTRSG